MPSGIAEASIYIVVVAWVAIEARCLIAASSLGSSLISTLKGDSVQGGYLKYSIASSDSRSARLAIEYLILSSWVGFELGPSTLASSRLIGWLGASFRDLMAYWRILVSKRTLGGNSPASASIGKVGAVLKTPSILLRARFCSACRGRRSWLWPLHHTAIP